MATIKNFEDLEIWQIARRLSLSVYNLTGNGLYSRDFRFRDQTRDSAGSVMDNIAEGFERSSRLEFITFLGFSKGSSGEIRSQLYRAIDQQYANDAECQALILEYKNLASKIAGFIQYLNASSFKGQRAKNRAK